MKLSRKVADVESNSSIVFGQTLNNSLDTEIHFLFLMFIHKKTLTQEANVVLCLCVFNPSPAQSREELINM